LAAPYARYDPQLRGARVFDAENSPANVEILEADAYASPLSAHSFDLTHVRFRFAPVGRDAQLMNELWRSTSFRRNSQIMAGGRNGKKIIFDCFLSYSHTDRQRVIAQALQRGLHRFARPFWRVRAVRVFRDETNLSANPALFDSITDALNSSNYFLLLASPLAAQSRWVAKELRHWLTHRGTENLIVVLTDGDLLWDASLDRFCPHGTTALPSETLTYFSKEPFYVDLRWAKDPVTELTVENSHFADAVATVSASIRGVQKDEIIGEDIRLRRLTKTIAGSGMAVLAALSVGLAVATYIAVEQRRVAVEQRDEAKVQRESSLARQLAAEAQLLADRQPQLLHHSVLLAVEATRRSPSIYSDRALRAEVALLPQVITTIHLGDSAKAGVFSYNGNYIATACDDGTAAVWEVATGRNIAQVRHADGVTSIAFSPDDHLVASAGYDGSVQVWEVLSGRIALSIALKDPVNSLAFSPDGSYFVAATNGDHVFVWKTATGENVRSFTVDDNAQQVAFSRNGDYLAARTWKSVWIWRSEHWQPVGEIRHGSVMNDFSFSADSKTIATASTDHTARAWTLPALEQTTVVRHEQNVRTVRFNPNNAILATGSRDSTARLWNIRTNHEEHLLTHRAIVLSLAFSPSGRYLATSSSDHTGRVWDVDTGREISCIGHGGIVGTIAFSPDGEYVATASADHTVKVWEAHGNPAIRYLPHQDSGIDRVTKNTIHAHS
jgi:WD40 repeat protein